MGRRWSFLRGRDLDVFDVLMLALLFALLASLSVGMMM